MKFCSIFKDLRKEFNYNQNDVAEKIGVTRSTVSDWETQRSEPSVAQLNKIADLFNVSIDYLVGREDDFGVISSSESSLNGEEERLLSLFRQLPNTRKKTILDTMSDMVSARKLSEDVS